jgi:dGTPase
MNSTAREISEADLSAVQAKIYQHKDGITLDALKKEVDASLDVERVVMVLAEQNAIDIRADQTLFAGFEAPPMESREFGPKNDPRQDRFHPEPLRLTDPRSRFVRDRERIIFSSAFRRLARVTQVFPVGTEQVRHNRLTHSIKAGHIAHSIVEQLKGNYQQWKDLERDKQIDADVVEGAALAHDIGHPPFGHAGEYALNACMKDYGGFEGNAQTFRVLTKLSRIRPEFHGLNLTRATLNAVIKYPWFRGGSVDQPGKWNAYSTERAEFEFARANHTDKSLEAHIMELSDDIAYGSHDLEDGIREGCIPIDQLVSRSGDGYDRLVAHLEARLLKKGDGKGAGLFESLDQVLFALGILRLGGNALMRPFADDSDQRGQLRRLTTLLHQRYLLAVTASPNLHLPPPFARELKVLKEIMGCFVFGSLRPSQDEQQKMIRTLFEHFRAAGQRDRKVFDPRIQDSLAQDERTSDEPELHIARAAADQVAIMTEDEVLRRYQEISSRIANAQQAATTI